MDYFQKNKAAWEEAFEHRRPGWGERDYERLLQEELPFFCPDVARELRTLDLAGKSVAQFCCNNGRELLSLLQLGAKEGVGFDIAENILAQARDTAQKAGIGNCRFVACNILDIPPQYHGSFDLVLFTIGAITWFEDLRPLLQKVSACLKPGGVLFLHDFHPVMNMLPMPGEEAFDPQHLDRMVYSYFRKEPWLEQEGMSYLSEPFPSKTFTSFSHTMADIINAASGAHLCVTKLNEYDYDVGLSEVYDHKGFPLSYLLLARKQER